MSNTPAPRPTPAQADAMQAIFSLHEAIESGLTIQDLIDVVQFAVAEGHGKLIIALEMSSFAVARAGDGGAYLGHRKVPEMTRKQIYAHCILDDDVMSLIDRLRTIDEEQYDCFLMSWRQARALAAHFDTLQDTIRQLADRVADQSESLSRRAEEER